MDNQPIPQQINTESEIVATPPSKNNGKIIGIGFFIIFLFIGAFFISRKYVINTKVPCNTNADCQVLPCSFAGYCPIFYCLNKTCYEVDPIIKPTFEPLKAPKTEDEVYTCKNDRDCFTISSGFCDCMNGGSNTSINKKYIPWWKENKMLQDKNQKCLAVANFCPTESKCSNSKCMLISSPTLNIPSVITQTPQTNNDWQTIESKSGYYSEDPNKGKFTISYPTDICSIVSSVPKNPNIKFNKLRDQYLQCNKDGYSLKMYTYAGGSGVGKTMKIDTITLGQYIWRRVVFEGPFTDKEYGVFYDTSINGLTYYIQIHFGSADYSDDLILTDKIITTFQLIN